MVTDKTLYQWTVEGDSEDHLLSESLLGHRDLDVYVTPPQRDCQGQTPLISLGLEAGDKENAFGC